VKKIINFINEISAYELCFCIENLAILLISDYFNCNNIFKYITIIAAVFLIITTIISNTFNSYTSDVETSYQLEKYIIIPLNIIKTVFLHVINIIMYLHQVYSLKIMIFGGILVFLLLYINIKYYSTTLKIKGEILDD